MPLRRLNPVRSNYARVHEEQGDAIRGRWEVARGSMVMWEAQGVWRFELSSLHDNESLESMRMRG